MEKSKFESDEEKARHSTLNPAKREKKPRRVAVKNASFFLYKLVEEPGKAGKCLVLIDSFTEEIALRLAYEKALDEGIPEEHLEGFKGRRLVFAVKETKRRITVR